MLAPNWRAIGGDKHGNLPMAFWSSNLRSTMPVPRFVDIAAIFGALIIGTKAEHQKQGDQNRPGQRGGVSSRQNPGQGGQPGGQHQGGERQGDQAITNTDGSSRGAAVAAPFLLGAHALVRTPR
jgi:hypothetical protein